METSVVQLKRAARAGWPKWLRICVEWFTVNRSLALLIISGACLLLSWTGWVQKRYGFDPAWGTILISGIPLLNFALRGLILRRDVTAGVLVSTALVAAVAIGEYFAAGEVAFIMAIGELLEERTVARAGQALHRLASLVPALARVRRGDSMIEIPTSELRVGDRVLVRPGENIPVDGLVIQGESAVNQAAVTGESLPVDKTPGDEVFVGTTNTLGALEVEATRVGGETTLAKVIDLVRRAQLEKAPIVRLADKWAAWLVPASMLVAIIVGVVTQDIVRAVTILIVFCPCALCLATPTAMMAGIGNAATRGILIKGGAVCEQAGRIDAVVFDKTGTLTVGRPDVTEVVGFGGVAAGEALRLAGSVEQLSEHPIGRAIALRAEAEGLGLSEAGSFQATLGKGAKATVDGRDIGVGNQAFAEEMGAVVDLPANEWMKDQAAQGRSALLVVQEGSVVGGLAVSDQAREEAKEAVQALRDAGITHVEMLTGDSQAAAAVVAGELGLTGYRAGQLPVDKADAVKGLRTEGRTVAVVGDGINDAPALAVADLGIAMGVAGTDVAVETAGIALLTEDLRKVPEAIILSRRVMRTISQNLWASALLNAIAILLASTGWLGPVGGALWHNVGSVAVVANSARLIRWRG